MLQSEGHFLNTFRWTRAKNSDEGYFERLKRKYGEQVSWDDGKSKNPSFLRALISPSIINDVVLD